MIDEKKLIESSTWYPNILFKEEPTWKDGWNNCNRDWMKRIDELPKVILPDTTITGWIPCSERLPKNEQEVEITYVNKHWKTGEPLYFTCRAFYTDGTMTTEDSNYVWNDIDNWEYTENFDAYIIPEGWWEGVSFAEEFYPVDKPVIAWMPLPEPYKESED